MAFKKVGSQVHIHICNEFSGPIHADNIFLDINWNIIIFEKDILCHHDKSLQFMNI